jgi:hypothetical protein
VLAFGDWGDPMSRRRKSVATIDNAIDSALTWLFAALTIIALVAGLLAQITS